MLPTTALLLSVALVQPAPLAMSAVTVRTETFPRPPYSGATYYIYEQGGAPICTKLEVCNKFDECTATYRRGAFKDPEDVQTGAPYGTTAAMPISASKLARHVCLTKFGLGGSRR